MYANSLNLRNGQYGILLVGQHSSHQDYLHSLLEAKGFRIERAQTVDEACQKLVILRPDLVVADLAPDELHDPLVVFRRLLDRPYARGRAAPLIVLNQIAEFGAAAQELHRAGVEFLSKPVLADELWSRISRLLGGSAQRRPALEPDFQPSPAVLPPELILGTSPAMQRVLEQVRLVAPKNTSVLVTGETGTGKERISRAIHYLSGRRNLPMVSVNCGGIPATLLEDEFFGHVKGAFTDAHQTRVGRFEQAHRSTIFLDEIGDLPLELQPKLLRVLQEREIHRIGGVEAIELDVRVIAATNVDLWERVGAGRFREDLYYRINVFPIHLPPLRERREDIPLFVHHFLEKFCRRDGLAPKRLRPSAEHELMSRPWPGNIRELENAVEIAVIRSQERPDVDIADFPPSRPLHSTAPPLAVSSAGPVDLRSLVLQFERELITNALERTGGNKNRAARLLGLKRTTLLEKLKKLESASWVVERRS
jgi:DNA-binding NtrC family response regulator